MLNIDVNPYLDKEISDLVLSLEKLTNELGKPVAAGEFIAGLAEGTENLEDLKDLNEVLKEKKRNPNPKTYTSEELGKMLGFI